MWYVHKRKTSKRRIFTSKQIFVYRNTYILVLTYLPTCSVECYNPFHCVDLNFFTQIFLVVLKSYIYSGRSCLRGEMERKKSTLAITAFSVDPTDSNLVTSKNSDVCLSVSIWINPTQFSLNFIASLKDIINLCLAKYSQSVIFLGKCYKSNIFCKIVRFTYIIFYKFYKHYEDTR